MDQVVDVMRSNVNKVLERDVKLGELDARAENLEAASNSFATSAKRVRKKMWWENLKMKLIIGGVLLAILIVIITIIAVEVRRVTPPMNLNEPSVPLLMQVSGGGGGGSSGGGGTTNAPALESGAESASDAGATG